MHKIALIMRIAPFLLAHGIAPATLLRRLRLPSSLLLEEQAWIDRRTSLLLSQEAARTTGDLLAGLHIAELMEFSDFGDWGDGIVHSRTLLDAISFARREIAQIQTGTRLELFVSGKWAHFSVDLIGDAEIDPRQFLEGSLLLARTIVDLAVETVPSRVRFPHGRIHGLDLGPLFGPHIEYRTGRAELVFDREALCLLIRPPVPNVVVIALQQNTPDDVARRVMRVLRETIDFERPTAQGVAAALSINVRMMQRLLARWGVTFEELLDQYRRRAAHEYLSSRTHSITDVAFRLGYSDSAHFTRAFRRWTGRSPREVLQSLPVPLPAAAHRGSFGRGIPVGSPSGWRPLPR